jgi:hypothetical protein
VSVCTRGVHASSACIHLQQVWQVWQYVTMADVHRSAASVASVAVCHDGRCAPLCSKCGKCGSMSRRQMCTALQQVWQVWQYVTTADVHRSAASVASVAVCHDGRCAPLCSKSVHHARHLPQVWQYVTTADVHHSAARVCTMHDVVVRIMHMHCMRLGVCNTRLCMHAPYACKGCNKLRVRKLWCMTECGHGFY